MQRHRLSTYDTTGEPIGLVCECPIGDDHNARGELVDPLDDDAERARTEVSE